MKNLIQIQQEYIDTVSLGMDRWSHRKDGGHISRIKRGARHNAEKALAKLGFSKEMVDYQIKQAHDVMLLERASVDDELNHAV